MKLLITGIHGFVGSNLVAALCAKNEIYGLDIVSPEKKGVVRTFSWDDLESGKVPDVDAIIHLAGKAHDVKNKAAADVYFRINTGLTQRIFDYFQKSPASKFIFFSSVKAAADFVPGDVLTEDVPTNPVGPYGESKIKAEEYINANDRHEKSVYILRPCMIHGPGNKGNLNLLYSVVRKRIPWPLGSFENRRTFTSIDNLTFVIDKLLSLEVPSGTYQMADDDSLSTNELIGLICKGLGIRSHIWRISPSLMRAVAKVGDLLHLPLNSVRLTKLTENYVVSNQKLKSALGIKKMPVSSSDGIIKTIKSFAQ
ncbi:MAG: NAD-dependent epimerase/dehydratase family protein [Candidatus Egerieousia sp.]